MRRTFQLQYNGEITRLINHDATAEDMQSALNQLSSIAPSEVVVNRSTEQVKTGPANGVGGVSTQVGGYVWYVTFASNTWRDPIEHHNSFFVPGNWVGSAASYSDTWESGFSKAWGRNVGDVDLLECIDSGLSTTNGVFPTGGCTTMELIKGTEPLGVF